ncbi:aldo/keto reductase [Williamsia phyllosphaerae]|uniref:NADP-dependent aryl-alcohol dehydrogenase n=1 Tax=Williamsia phyllosphaerae TaxID=885042 RepID=A0ABQ1UHM6_9NOCA|nr:aldo/keto reductase [Williamsia phyllosphaerae]GGF17030.1 NADP-dependent aryl-alcohol dehydrogenase [Williamsia phyllosphaerae]
MVQIGPTDLDTFPLVLGGNTFGWTSDEQQSGAVLDAFTDAGGSFVDTADQYSQWAPGHSGGESETVLGNWLARRGNRDSVIVATKVGKREGHIGLSPDNIRASVDGSLKRLQTDHIDIYYAHAEDPTVPLHDIAVAFDGLVVAGKIRHIGLSNFSPVLIEEWFSVADALGLAKPVALQPQYSLVHRTEYEGGLQQIAVDNGLAVLPYWGLASGFLTGKYTQGTPFDDTARASMASGYATDEGYAVLTKVTEIADAHGVEPATVALAWLTTRSQITAPIASARTPEQLPALLAAATLELSDDDLAALEG